MSGTQESTAYPLRNPARRPKCHRHFGSSSQPTRSPLELQSASTNRALGGGVCKALPRTRYALSCASISLCGLKPSAAPALTSPTLGVGSPSRVVSQYGGKNFRFCIMTRKGPLPEGEGEGELDAARRLRSRRKILAQESGADGVVLRTPRLRAQGFSKRDEAQGGSWGVRGRHAVLPSTPDMSIFFFCSFVSKWRDTLLKKRSARYHLQALERWLSGRRHVPAKDAYPSKGTVGSNPTLSDFFFNKRPA